MSNIHLASGVIDDTVRIEEVSENVEIPLQFGRTQIPKTSSKIKLNHICFTDNTAHHTQFNRHINDDIVKIIRTQQLKLFFESKCVSHYGLNFIIDLNSVTVVENTYCVKLPYDFMFGEILLESMANHDLYIEFLCSTEFRHNIEVTLLYEKIMVSEEMKRGLLHEKQTRDVQCIDKVGDCVITRGNNINIPLQIGNQTHYTKGLFVQCDVNKITNMELMLNGDCRFSYNKVMIQLYCKIISDFMFYVPLNNQNDFYDIRMQSYANGINCTGVNSMQARFNFNSGNVTINIYVIHHNVMIYMNGFTMLAKRHDATILQNSQPTPLFVAMDVNRNVRSRAQFYTTMFANIETRLCPITHENITLFYGKCLKCNNVFDFTAISNWLKDHPTCPLCRNEWTNYVMYERIVNATT